MWGKLLEVAPLAGEMAEVFPRLSGTFADFHLNYPCSQLCHRRSRQLGFPLICHCRSSRGQKAAVSESSNECRLHLSHHCNHSFHRKHFHEKSNFHFCTCIEKECIVILADMILGTLTACKLNFWCIPRFLSTGNISLRNLVRIRQGCWHFAQRRQYFAQYCRFARWNLA